MSIYDWMLQYSLNGLRTSNPALKVNAGPDDTLNPEATSGILVGSGTDEDGTITAYHWTTASDATLTAPDSPATTVTGLKAGTSYAFTLTVTDNNGTTAADGVVITVQSPSSGPTLIIDEDTAITSPLASYTFDSVSVIPANGNTFSPNSSTVLWTLLSKPAGSAPFWSGPQYQLNGHSLGNMNKNGSYVVTLKVTQSDGTSTTDTTTITRAPSNDSSAISGSKKDKNNHQAPAAKEYIIYPNPATTSAITIVDKLKNPLGQINIYDLNGRLIQTRTTNESRIILQLSVDAPGVYIVQIIKSHHHIYTEKVIVSPKRPE
jgi:hypothetical protein